MILLDSALKMGLVNVGLMVKILTICSFILTVKLGFARSAESNQENKGWLRICNGQRDLASEDGSQHYEVEADKCPHGSWLSESLAGGCVCLNGLWAISQNWCDEDYHLLYGKGDCFKLENQIQKLAFLGNPSDPFESTNFVTKENGHVFRSFSNEFRMPYEYSRESNRTILRLKPGKSDHIILEVHPETWAEYISQSNSVLREEEPICFDTDRTSGWSEEMLVIYKMRTGIKYIRVTEQCPKPTFYDGVKDRGDTDTDATTIFKVLPGQGIHMKTGRIIKASKNCPLDCQSTTGEFASSPKLIRHKRSPDADDANGPVTIAREFSEQDRDATVNSANLRVVKQELNWLLENIPPPALNTQNWKLVKKIRAIFVKACDEAPQFLVDAMVRIFRLLFLHTRDYNPNGHVLEEFKQYGRIQSVLDECLAGADKFSFGYHKVKIPNQSCRNISELVMDLDSNNSSVENTTLCPCSTELEKVNLKYSLNLTGPVQLFNLTGENLTMTEDMTFVMPMENQFDGRFHDVPTETVWKIINFAHYYCAKYFRYQPADHSALITKLENLFNDDIMYRWTRPGMNSNKVWQYLYSSFNFKKYAKAVDACVAGAKFVSEYPEWLTRPTSDSRRRRKRSLNSEKLWSGSAYCLEDPWDPVNKLGVSASEKCADFNTY